MSLGHSALLQAKIEGSRAGTGCVSSVCSFDNYPEELPSQKDKEGSPDIPRGHGYSACRNYCHIINAK
jgi:hypothetical protein